MTRCPLALVTIIGVVVLTTFAGCMPFQLRMNAVRQADTYSEFHEQQVLNNLAKFVYNINSFPSFCYSNQALNQLQNTASIASITTWERIAGGIYGWFSSTANPSLSQLNQENWTLVPINDPRKLDLMRCAYQQVVRANMRARGISKWGI
jgi:hypothetical protein